MADATPELKWVYLFNEVEQAEARAGDDWEKVCGLLGGKGMFGKMKMAKQLSSMDMFSGQAQFKRKQRSKRKKTTRKRHRR